MALLLTCIADVDSEFTCTVHINNIVNGEYDGHPEMPEALWHVLTLKNVVGTNCNIWEDILVLHTSFFSDRVLSVPYVDTTNLYRAACGEHWAGFDHNNKPKPTSGVLNIFNHAFKSKNLTWYKSPKLTLCNWWGPWSDPMRHYSLMDVQSIAMVLRKVMDILAKLVSSMVTLYSDQGIAQEQTSIPSGKP